MIKASSDLKGRLLVARPVIGDPNFSRTVIYVIEHSDEGSVGVVINHPSETSLDIVLAGWHEYASQPHVVFVGGPVGIEAALCLALVEPGSEPAGCELVRDGIYMLDLNDNPDELGPTLLGFRVFLGYAGWGPEQLDGEIEAEGWFVVEAEVEDVFAIDPTNLYREVMRRQRGEEALIATFPDEPELN